MSYSYKQFASAMKTSTRRESQISTFTDETIEQQQRRRAKEKAYIENSLRNDPKWKSLG